MTRALAREALDAAGLRKAAGGGRAARAARLMLARAMVSGGTDRKTAAEACGMDRQRLRDRVQRKNAEGLAGSADRRARRSSRRGPIRRWTAGCRGAGGVAENLADTLARARPRGPQDPLHPGLPLRCRPSRPRRHRPRRSCHRPTRKPSAQPDAIARATAPGARAVVVRCGAGRTASDARVLPRDLARGPLPPCSVARIARGDCCRESRVGALLPEQTGTPGLQDPERPTFRAIAAPSVRARWCGERAGASPCDNADDPVRSRHDPGSNVTPAARRIGKRSGGPFSAPNGRSLGTVRHGAWAEDRSAMAARSSACRS
jgi:hypothetical protein